MTRDVLYWSRKLRNKVKQTVQLFQQEELKQNQLAKTDLRDVIIVCAAESLPKVAEMPLQEFKLKVSKLKSKG